MPTYEQTPVRLQFSLVGDPPAFPLDANTGNAPRIWRGSCVGVAVGVFDALAAPVDLSNVAFLQLVIQKAEDSLTPLVVKTLTTADLLEMTTGGWVDGTEQQAIFSLTSADTDQGLEGLRSSSFWVSLLGLTSDGNPVAYGAGPLTIYNAGGTIPSPLAGYVSRHRQACNAGNVTASPTSNNHTEIVDVGGVARDTGVILPIPGIADGALMRLDLRLPLVADINLRVFSGTAIGAVLAQVKTDGTMTRAVLQFYFDKDLGQWVRYQDSSSNTDPYAVTDSDGNAVTDSDGQAVTTSP